MQSPIQWEGQAEGGEGEAKGEGVGREGGRKGEGLGGREEEVRGGAGGKVVCTKMRSTDYHDILKSKCQKNLF
jgi:hypothetical protein